MKKLIYEYRKLIIFFIIPYLAIIALGIIPTDYDVTSPGMLTKVESIIKVDNGYFAEGSFNTISVYSVERCSALTYLFGNLNKKVSVEPTNEYIQMTGNESRTSGTIQKNVSIVNALIAAYESAGKVINKEFQGLIVHTTFTDLPFDIQIGDVITAINGENVTTNNEFLESLRYFVKNNQTVTLTVKRNSKIHEVEYKPIPTDVEGTYYVGIYCYDYYTINQALTTPQYTIGETSSYGPSGGLMQALSIYNAITEYDLTNGLKIAGTGTIEVNGEVGAIGGIYQKVFTAYLSHADVFLVPVNRDSNGNVVIVQGYTDEETGQYIEGNNYFEAMRAYEVLGKPQKMAFVPVATLSEAVEYLKGVA